MMTEDTNLEQTATDTEAVSNGPAVAVPQTAPLRVVGYHFGGLSFYPGRDGVRDVHMGDINIPGTCAIKVTPTGTGKKARIFIVPLSAVIIENEETPVIVPGGGSGLIVPGR